MKISDYLTVTRDTLHAYNKLCQPVLQKHRLPQVSFDILMFLSNNPELCTAQDISTYRNIKKNLVSVHVDKLVSAGLLERGLVHGDRRKIALSCTRLAQPIVADGLAMQRRFYERLRQGISPEDWAVYQQVHRRMRENTRKMENEEVLL